MGSSLRRPGLGQLALLDRDGELPWQVDNDDIEHARTTLAIARAVIAETDRKRKEES